MPKTAKVTTVVDDLPYEQRLCRGLTGHRWNFGANKARKVGRYWLIFMPCDQCGKIASILMDRWGNQMRGRAYHDPEGWIQDKRLNTVQGRAAMRASLIPLLHEEQ